MAFGQIPHNKGKGAAARFLLDNVGYEGDDCLTWPFCRDKHGRGLLSYNGTYSWAHRLMCKLAKGEPPTPKHTAAHECGKGHEGCVNPRHLTWKTQKENMADCAIHGTQPKQYDGNRGRMTPEQVQSVKDLRGIKTQGDLAAMYAVSEGAINDIWRGRSHARPSKVPHWTGDEVQKLREAIDMGKSISQMALHVGTKSRSSVMMKLYRLGLKSKWVSSQSAEPQLYYPNGER